MYMPVHAYWLQALIMYWHCWMMNADASCLSCCPSQRKDVRHMYTMISHTCSQSHRCATCTKRKRNI